MVLVNDQYFLDKNVLKSEVFLDGVASVEPIKCPSEIKQPFLDWTQIWERARLKGLSNESRSFLFLLLNDLLLLKERQYKVTRNTPSRICTLCDSGEVDSS